MPKDDSINEGPLQIELITRDQSRISGTVALKTTYEYPKGCSILLSCQQGIFSATATDFFAAFADIRNQLAKYDLLPCCYGASRNVYPSGMGREMGRGLRAYRMTPGKHAHFQTDLVNIFATGPDIDPVSPELQREFFLTWAASERV